MIRLTIPDVLKIAFFIGFSVLLDCRRWRVAALLM